MAKRKKKQHRSCDCGTETVQGRLERLINRKFTAAELRGLGYSIRGTSSTAEGNVNSAECMTAHICELRKYLDAAFPVPAYDRTGILMHSRLKLLSRGAGRYKGMSREEYVEYRREKRRREHAARNGRRAIETR